MNVLNSTTDEVVECPLCMEPLEVDDLNFYPCTCGYQICRFCWHRIRTDENELCPACRKEYPENPADFTPLTQEEMIAFKSQKRQRDQQRKQKITENRKHLANVRVVQKNLVFVVGLPPRLADADILKKHEYFGKYGKIHKVVINPSTAYAGVQGPSASAYVTYVHNSDALRAIQSVNNIMIDGRLIKTSLGTTKYCSHFMKNQQCPKSDCMYLHELGDSEASFTKEEMHQGKHQEYEKRLHDALIATYGSSINAISVATSNSGPSSSAVNGGSITHFNNSKNVDACKVNNGNAISTVIGGVVQTAIGVQQKDAWPSLAVSPVNNKETFNGCGNSKTRKEKLKHEKKNEKCVKSKNKNSSYSNHNTNNISNLIIKDNNNIKESCSEQLGLATQLFQLVTAEHNYINKNNKSHEQSREVLENKSSTNLSKEQLSSPSQKEKLINVDEEIKLIETSDSKNTLSDNSFAPAIKDSCEENKMYKLEHRSQSSRSNLSYSSGSNNSDNTSVLEECTSGVSSPGSFPGSNVYSEKLQTDNKTEIENGNDIEENGTTKVVGQCKILQAQLPKDTSKNEPTEPLVLNKNCDDSKSTKKVVDVPLNHNETLASTFESNNMISTAATISKLNVFDDTSYFTTVPEVQQSVLLKNNMDSDIGENHMNSITSPHLPDLLNGIDGYKNNTSHSNDWEDAFKNVIKGNNKQAEEQLQQNHLLQQQLNQHQFHQQEEMYRLRELQKRSSLYNTSALSQLNGPPHFSNNTNVFHINSEINRLSQSTLMHKQTVQEQQQRSGQANDQFLEHNTFPTNMSKFFDFHKNQQQIHQQFVMTAHANRRGNSPVSDSLRMVSLLENSLNTQFSEQMDGHLSTQPQQQQKQRLNAKLESVQPSAQNHQIQNSQTQQKIANRIPNKFSQNVIVDDDLGFDPFHETQKALAELMENELIQNQSKANPNKTSPTAISEQGLQPQNQIHLLDNIQRACLPPPGFTNNVNSYGYTSSRSHCVNNHPSLMNITGHVATNNIPQHLQISTNWNTHVPGFQQQNQGQQQLLHDQQVHSLNQNQNGGSHGKGFNSNDWTALDPAILSFRQYSFPQHPQVHPPTHDLFFQHLAQQQQQHTQSFNSQSQLQNTNTSMLNPLMNSQQTAQTQVNANVQGMLEYLKLANVFRN